MEGVIEFAEAAQKVVVHTDIVAAADQGEYETVDFILKLYPSEVDCQFHGSTALQNASRKGHIEVMKLLVSEGADIDLDDVKFQTPLHYAVNGNQPHAVELLLNFGAKMEEENADGETAPQVAFKNNYKDCVKIFMQRNPDIVLKKAVKHTTLSTAQQCHKEESTISQPDEQCAKKSVEPCHYCKERAVIVTFEPCEHKLSCFMCSLKSPACACGQVIVKRRFDDNEDTADFIQHIKDSETKARNVQEELTCSICRDRKINCFLEGCGHVFCIPCVRKCKHKYRNHEGLQIWLCSTCKRPSRYQKLYV